MWPQSSRMKLTIRLKPLRMFSICCATILLLTKMRANWPASQTRRAQGYATSPSKLWLSAATRKIQYQSPSVVFWMRRLRRFNRRFIQALLPWIEKSRPMAWCSPSQRNSPGVYQSYFQCDSSNAGRWTLRAYTKPASGTVFAPRLGIRVTISDTGVGIPLKHRSRIFEPFFTTKEEKRYGDRAVGQPRHRPKIRRHDSVSLEKISNWLCHLIRCVHTDEWNERPRCINLLRMPQVSTANKGAGPFQYFVSMMSAWGLIFGKRVLESVGHRVVTARSGEEVFGCSSRKRLISFFWITGCRA